MLKPVLQRNLYLVLLIVLCLPLLWLNVKDSHDWGDDFAQYLTQARNIIEHRSQLDNGLVFDSQTGEYALKTYPVAFPLMLAVIWKLVGYSIHSFLMLEAFFTIGFALLIFVFLKRKFTPALSFVLTLAAVYNPVFLAFKKEILADIPFAFFFLLSILLLLKCIEQRQIAKEEKENNTGNFKLLYVLTGIIFGWTLSIKGIGIVLFAALLAVSIKELVRKIKTGKTVVSLFSPLAIIFSTGVVTYLLLNAVIFPTASGSFFGFYKQAFKEYNTFEMIAANAQYYYEVLKYFFNQGDGIWYKISDITKYVMVYSFLAGMVISWKQKFGFDDIAFILYFVVLMIYPYQAGGFRFWIPLIPFLFQYIGVAIKTLFELMRFPSPQKIVALLMLIIFFQNMNGVASVVAAQNLFEDGPQKPSAVDMLEFVKSKLSSDAVVVFVKPRALSFYTGKRTAFAQRKLSAEQNYQSFQRMKALCFLLSINNSKTNDEPLKKVIDANKDRMKVLWQNEDFVMYSDLN